jgi:hypothetical protein
LRHDRLVWARLLPDRLIMGRLTLARLIPGRLATGRLTLARLIPGHLISGHLIPSRLIADWGSRESLHGGPRDAVTADIPLLADR